MTIERGRAASGVRQHRRATAWRQEDGAAQIDADHPVEVLRHQVEQVAAHRRAPMPALLTRQSMRPKWSTTLSTRSPWRESARSARSGSGRSRPLRARRADGCGRRLVAVGDVGDGEVEAGRGEGLGDGAADAAARAGDDGDGRGLHAAMPPIARFACSRIGGCGRRRAEPGAAMVSAGLTAAEVGRKPASTTNRFGWSRARQKGSSGEVAGSLPKRTVPHWCDGVRRSNGRRSTIGIAAGAEQLAHACARPSMRRSCWSAASPGRSASVDTTRLSGSGRSSLIRVPVDACAAQPCEREIRAPSAGWTLRIAPVILPRSWTLPSGGPPSPSAR